MSGLLEGFITVLSPINLGYCFLGCVLGTAVGMLPGLGPAATMAMLIPLAAYMPQAGAIIMLSGILYGAMYGGSTTSILMNVPGEASSVATCIDGFQMTKQGRAGEALAIAAIGSFIAGTGGVLLLSIAGPTIADFALYFGPPEYFGLVIFSLTALMSFSGRELFKGVATGMVGMMLACIGLDPVTAKYRLVFGISNFISGMDVVPILMGLFGVTEVLISADQKIASVYQGKLGRLIPRGQELKRGLLASLRGTASGLVFGLFPGMIASVTTFISYDIEKRISNYPEQFGKGVIEGVAAPEANNNAVCQAGFIPLFAFGIPTMPVFAILLAVLMMYGLSPGPLLFSAHGDFTWAVIASMYIGNVMLLVLNLPLVGLWAKLCLIPYKFLGPGILGMCFIGAYSLRNSMFDVWTCIFFGIVGYALKKRNWPAPPLILGFILGPMLEQHLRASLQTSGGSMDFVFKPIPLIFIALAIFLVAFNLRFRSAASGLEEKENS